MPTATHTPTIPTPPRHRMIEASQHTMLCVDLNGTDAVYAYDGTHLSLSLVSQTPSTVLTARRRVSAVDLSQALSEGRRLGKPVATASVSCGGLLDYGSPIFFGMSEEYALLREAIQHFYAVLDDAEQRKALRAVYRRLPSSA